MGEDIPPRAASVNDLTGIKVAGKTLETVLMGAGSHYEIGYDFTAKNILCSG